MTIRPLRLEHYPAVHTFWQGMENMGLSSADSRGSIARYLERNPGMSFVALEGERIVGTLLAGHDGRRGYLHHAAVDPSFRRRGVGRRLVEAALSALRAAGIEKAHLFIFPANGAGKAFWRSVGWHLRDDIELMSRNL